MKKKKNERYDAAWLDGSLKGSDDENDWLDEEDDGTSMVDSERKVTFGADQIQEFDTGSESMDDGTNLTRDQFQDQFKRFKEERSHALFPDEVDTPIDTPAS